MDRKKKERERDSELRGRRGVAYYALVKKSHSTSTDLQLQITIDLFVNECSTNYPLEDTFFRAAIPISLWVASVAK